MIIKLVFFICVVFVCLLGTGCTNTIASNEYLKKGMTKAQSGDYYNAIDDFDKAIEYDSKNTEAYKNRGIAKRNSGNSQSAIADFNMAIELSSNNGILFNERGLAREALQAYEYAIEDYSKAIELSNNFTEAYLNRGDCKFKIKDTLGACSDWEKSMKLNRNAKQSYDSYCKKDRSNTLNDIKINTSPESPESIKMRGLFQRRTDLLNNNTCKFLYVYKNDVPFGKFSTVYYDDFYKTYKISFTNSSGIQVEFKIKDANFTEDWGFNYGGGKYQLSNYKFSE